jgi:putative phosphoesterase
VKLGLISDTHNNTANLRVALERLQAAGVNELLHLGDVTSVETVRLLSGFRVHHTVGNGDYATGEIAHALRELDPANTSGFVFTGLWEGVSVAATHGHLEGKVNELVHAGEHAFVFHGHSHRRKDELHLGVRVVNPGALGGLRAGPRSCAVLELPAGTLTWIEID